LPVISEANANPPEAAPRRENLALIYQEFLTAIVRLRSNRQNVTDAALFRSQALNAMHTAEQQARGRGYTDEDVRLADFAVVAFLDESILNLRNPIFKDWVRRPLQEELFGRHTAGEIFFQNMEQILGRRDSPETADLLEVYYLCLLLGYLGRYSISSKADLRNLMRQADDKIQRIRNTTAEMSPGWRLPPEKRGVARRDGVLMRLRIVAAAIAVLTLILFVGYHSSLSSGVSRLEQIAEPAGR
jgi:type VI secretion system protein ImpK